jgi:tripartite-type tricarboxylate transporter receptor subunit TctC
MLRRHVLRLAAIATLTPAASVQAQAFPARPITLLVGFPPGTASDTVSRFLADRMGRSLGQTMTVENRPGVDGGIAATAVARARPDGYTLLYSTSSAHAANVSLYRSPGYDPAADFTPIGGVLRQPTVVLVRADSPVRDLAGLAALSQRNAAGLNHGFGNTSTRIVGEMLQRRGNVRTTGVSFRGNPQSLTELIAGRLDFAVADAFTGTAQVRAGTLRALAVSGAAPSAALPGAPSLVTMGVLEDPIVAWTGIFAPAGLPAPIRSALGAAMAAAMTGPDWDGLMDRLVAESQPLSGDALGALVRADIARWAAYVTMAGIEPQ